jgi:hypothetical protein
MQGVLAGRGAGGGLIADIVINEHRQCQAKCKKCKVSHGVVMQGGGCPAGSFCALE